VDNVNFFVVDIKDILRKLNNPLPPPRKIFFHRVQDLRLLAVNIRNLRQVNVLQSNDSRSRVAVASDPQENEDGYIDVIREKGADAPATGEENAIS